MGIKKLLLRCVQAAGPTTALLASTAFAAPEPNAAGLLAETGPVLEGPMPAGPIQVQPIGQPTVGGTPYYVESYSYWGSKNNMGLPEVGQGKEVTPSARHWRFLLGITVGMDYDDNIFLTSSGKSSDLIFAFSPTVGIQFGDRTASSNSLTFTYTPTFVVFASHSDENAIEHAVDLQFVRQSEIWKFTGNFDFLALNGSTNPLRNGNGSPDNELIGERVDRQVYTLGLKYNYAVSDKTAIEIGLAGNYTHYQSFLDTSEVVSQNFFDYAISGKTKIGVGFGIGTSKTEGGASQVYEQALARVSYDATAKVKVELHGGSEFRQTSGGGGDEVNGIFGLGITYNMTERTSLTLAAYRNVNPSSLASDVNYTVTGVSLTATQKILDRLTFVLATGYENSDYHSFGDTQGVNRRDNYVYIHPSFVYQIGQRLTVEAFYEHRNNDSSLDEFQFANNRTGVKFGLNF